MVVLSLADRRIRVLLSLRVMIYFGPEPFTLLQLPLLSNFGCLSPQDSHLDLACQVQVPTAGRICKVICERLVKAVLALS